MSLLTPYPPPPYTGDIVMSFSLQFVEILATQGLTINRQFKNRHRIVEVISVDSDCHTVCLSPPPLGYLLLYPIGRISS